MRGIIILEVGRLVLGQESMDFRGKIKEVLEKSDWIKEKWGWNTRIVLDLGNLGFVDSAGLGALIAAHTFPASRGAAIKLAHLTKKLRDALSITKLATVFDVYDSVEEAVKSFPRPAPPPERFPLKLKRLISSSSPAPRWSWTLLRCEVWVREPAPTGWSEIRAAARRCAGSPQVSAGSTAPRVNWQIGIW